MLSPPSLPGLKAGFSLNWSNELCTPPALRVSGHSFLSNTYLQTFACNVNNLNNVNKCFSVLLSVQMIAGQCHGVLKLKMNSYPNNITFNPERD